MAFTYVGGAANNGQGTSATVTHGLSISAGDLVVAYINRNDDLPVENDAGGSAWTEAGDKNPAGETARHALFWKIAGASEPASYSWSLNGNDLYQVILKVFSSDTDAVVDSPAVLTDSHAGAGFMVVEAIDGAVISDGAVSLVFGGKDNRDPSGTWLTADNGYIGVLGQSASQDTAGAHRIYTTGVTFSGSVVLDGTATRSDNAYSAHISFVESTGGGGGTAQDVTLPDLNQATEVQTVSVSALAGITGLEADQDTQTQLGTVAADFGVVTSDADQDTNSQTATVAADITGDVADAQQQTNGDTATLVTDLDVITTDGEQVTQGDSAAVAVDLGVPGTEADQDTDISSGAVAVDLGVQSSQADQDTSVELLTISTDAITTINLVTAEQLHSASTANVSELNTVASVIVQQALGVELMTPAQVGSVSGVPGQSQVQGSTAGVITDISTNVVSADQLTQAQIINLLDGTGLSVVVVEQGTDFAPGDVTIINTVAVVSSEQGTEGETIHTGATAVLNVLNIEQMTEAEIADVLGSAMLVNPRTLRVKRTTIGYTVNRKTSAFRVTLKTT